jgi:precorrin-4 methylase
MHGKRFSERSVAAGATVSIVFTRDGIDRVPNDLTKRPKSNNVPIALCSKAQGENSMNSIILTCCLGKETTLSLQV